MPQKPKYWFDLPEYTPSPSLNNTGVFEDPKFYVTTSPKTVYSDEDTITPSELNQLLPLQVYQNKEKRNPKFIKAHYKAYRSKL